MLMKSFLFILALDLNNVSAELLNPALLTFRDEVVDDNGIAGPELGEFFLVADLLVYEGDGVHGCCKF